jgi:antirestriction protein ArdC
MHNPPATTKTTSGPPGPTLFDLHPEASNLEALALPSGRPPPQGAADFVKLAADALVDLERDLAAGKSETLVRFLATMGKFHHYSFNNVLLIALQRPDATQVAGFNTWKKLGRYVKKGEKGIGIIAPMAVGKSKAAVDPTAADDEGPRIRFRLVRVFDVSQTDGKPLAEFAEIRGDPAQHLARLRDIVTGRGIQLEYDNLEGGAEGISRGGSITIQAGLHPAKDFSVLVHELAHELLHQTDRRAATTKTQRETEAEAVAFVVSRAIGLECGAHASDYIQLYQGDANTLSASLSLIQATAAGILKELLSTPADPGEEDAGDSPPLP